MKKVITVFIVLLIASSLHAQVRVNFSVTNPRIESGKFVYDVMATVPSGQQWKVGPTCIRIQYNTVPGGSLSVQQDNPATNANLNLSGNSNYGNMTTTSILNDSAISLNVLQLFQRNCYYLTAGTYTLGSVRWNVVSPGACINISFLTYSTVFDSMTALTYQTQWTKTDTGCVPIGINTQLTGQIPVDYQLYQNYPNPFNPATKIRYDIPENSYVRLVIYDALGRVIESLVDQNLKAGTYEAIWDAGDRSSGLYFYKIIAGEFTRTGKMVLIK